MKALCNKTTKKIEAFSRWDDIEHDSNTHIQLIIDAVPDIENERLNNTEDGLRAITQAELDADADAELDEVADLTKADPLLKAYVLCINDGSVIPGSNMSNTALKAAIRVKISNTG